MLFAAGLSPSLKLQPWDVASHFTKTPSNKHLHFLFIFAKKVTVALQQAQSVPLGPSVLTLALQDHLAEFLAGTMALAKLVQGTAEFGLNYAVFDHSPIHSIF